MNTLYMNRAIVLAEKGMGFVNPNPMVGAVIVKEGQVIGEGYHEKYGGPHAEVNAINNATENVAGATMYVTLEPCSHYGKTPPCVNAILEHQIKKVVIGMTDPNPLVSGRGIELLKANGIEVITGILEKEVSKLNEIFIKYITTDFPFVIMKTAMTLDGKIASTTGDSKWITNESSRAYVHELRHMVSGIMVGIGTVEADNPYLTARNTRGIDPVRIIVDTKARIALETNILNNDSKAKTIIATTELANRAKLKMLQEKGAEIIITPIKNNQVDLKFLFKEIKKLGIDSVLLEGGANMNYSALEEQLVDKVYTFIAPKMLGGSLAKTPVGGKGVTTIDQAFLLENMEILKLSDDLMITGYVRR